VSSSSTGLRGSACRNVNTRNYVLAIIQLLKSYSNNHCKSLDPEFGMIFGKIKSLTGIQLLVVCLNSTFVASKKFHERNKAISWLTI